MPASPVTLVFAILLAVLPLWNPLPGFARAVSFTTSSDALQIDWRPDAK